MIWANLLHLSVNMWLDTPPRFAEELRFDEPLWNELTERMAETGFTMVIIDLGDGVLWDSHPEIAVRNAWTPDRLAEELVRLRGLGLEAIPKFNFSAGHDAWLKEYSRQVSTPVYYEVCRDLINEAAAIFQTPRFFHIGMDEETASDQRRLQIAVMRQHDLWWHDLELLAGCVEAAGCRPWVWSDPAWRHPEDYFTRMPKSILQSNWYYQLEFPELEGPRPRVLGPGEYHLTYRDLDDHGFEQVPTGSTWTGVENFGRTVDYCRKYLDPDRILGFMQTPWKMTELGHRDIHLSAIEAVRQAKEAWDSGRPCNV
ncbi:MAG TPA: hypothetical protein VHX59_08380 [Mycobacteriales bacterium]|nr:hypothetical protein [Mycobacteriales bacterium]